MSLASVVRVQGTRRLAAALVVLCAVAGGAVFPGDALARTSTREILPTGHVPARLVRSGVEPAAAAAPRTVPLRVRNPAALARAKLAATRAGSPTTPSVRAAATSTAVLGTLTAPGLSASQQISTFGENGDITPPDTTGAIGPLNYVEIVNSEIEVYDRSDLTPVTSALDLGTFTGGIDPCDPQVKYDPQSDRWYYLALRCDGTITDNQLYVGWSKTSDPSDLTTGWCKFTVASTPTTTLDDYPKLGLAGSHVIIGANAFDASGTPPFAHILVGAKPPPGTIGVCAAPSFTVFGSTSAPLITPAGNLASSPEPATISDTTSTVGYVIAADDDDTGSGSNLAVWQIGGTATAPTLSAPHDVPVSGFAAPPGVPQPGSSDTIDTLDSRLTQAVAAADPSDGGAETVWTQHTVSDGAGGSVVRWYEVAPATTTLVQSGTITNGPAGSFAFNGAIAPTRSGGAVIDYNTGGSTQDVKLLAQSRAATDAAGTMSSPITLATSSAIDSDFSCPSQPFGSVQGNGFCRWGDYAGASVDPDNQDVAWGSNQVNGPTGASIPGFGDQAQWRTQNFALTPSATSAPTASFTFSPNPVSPGSPVSFDASASNDPNSGGGITDFTWHFGDGTAQDTGTTASATHNYVAAGVYTVTLTVTASHGTSTTTHVVTVDAPPSASFTAAPNPVTPGGAVSFNASGSTDPNPGGTIAAYSWSFGDGTGASGATPAHAYGAPGAYPVTLTITDDHGQTASQTQTVIVDQPSATFTAAPNPTIPGAPVAFNAGGSSDAIASISAYSWSFGDGTGATGATPSHAYSAPGSYVVTLVVTNNFGQTATSSTVVTVDAPPTASFTIVPNPATVGTPVGFNASGSTAPPGVSAGYTWAFGDGGTASGPVVSHSYTSPGTYAVTLIVVDSDGQSATTIERVTIVPRPPGKPPPLTGRLSMRHQRVAAIRKHGLVVTLSTNQGRQATFRIIARIKPSRAGRKQTSLTLLRGRTLTVASGTHRLVLKLSKASARALASKHVTSLTVTVVVVDAFGQKLTRSASFRL